MEVWATSEHVSGIDANRTIKDELIGAIAQQRQRRRVSVTDLLNPRQAFFRRTHPEIRPSPQRLQMMLAGVGFHDLFGRATSTEEFVEQFIECERVVGKIDIYEDLPVELKTTASMPKSPLDRSSYLDQLGMYCAMVGKPCGRLILYKRSMFGQPPLLRVFQILYSNLDAICDEMLRRRDMLVAALEEDDASALPRCEWYKVGCDYHRCCGCERAAVGPPITGASSVRAVEDREACHDLLRALCRKRDVPHTFRLNDLVFPRKVALERAGSSDEQETTTDSTLASMEREGFKGALYQALRFGSPGAFTRLPVALRSLTGIITMYKGVPTLLRSTRFTSMVERERLADTLTHYFDRLAFECALTGNLRGRLILYYEAIPGDKFMVYDVWFGALPIILAEVDRRLRLLETGAPASELPPCPAWMAKFCRFAKHCGCADQHPRVA